MKYMEILGSFLRIGNGNFWLYSKYFIFERSWNRHVWIEFRFPIFKTKKIRIGDNKKVRRMLGRSIGFMTNRGFYSERLAIW